MTSNRYWLDRANETRLLAEEITHPPSKRELLKIAEAYSRLAERARTSRQALSIKSTKSNKVDDVQ